MTNNLKTRSRACFPKSDQVWPKLTKFDQGWLSVDQGFDRAVPDPTRVHHAEKPSKRGPGYISQSLESFDQVWPRFDRTVDQNKSWIELTAPWPFWRVWWELRFSTLRAKNGWETRELWSKLWKNGPTLSQILLSIVDKTAYLGGRVCT